MLTLPVYEHVAARASDVHDAAVFMFDVPKGRLHGSEFISARQRIPMKPPFPKLWVEISSGRVSAAAFFQRVEDTLYRVDVCILQLDYCFSTFVKFDEAGYAVATGELPSDLGDVERRAAISATAVLCSALYCLGLCHVDNAEIHDAQMPRHLRRRLKNIVKDPDAIRLKVIDIRPVGAKSSKGETHEVIQMALHWVRGHFAIYTEERPLFGKHVGRFWISAHRRGNSDYGTNEHIYKA